MKYLICLLMTLLSTIVYAGDRGYSIAFIDASTAPYNDGKALTLKLRAMPANDANECFMCTGTGGDRVDVSMLVINKIPSKLTVDLAQKALSGDKTYIKKLCNVLKNHTDEDAQLYGLDGVFIYKRDALGVTVNAIGSNPSQYVFKKAFHPVKNIIKLENLDKLFKKTSSAFLDGFAP